MMQDKDFEQAIEEMAQPHWECIDVDDFINEVREPAPDALVHVVRRGEGDEMADYIVSLYPDWAFVLKPDLND